MPATAQLSKAREMQAERTEDCTICEKTGCLTADGWYSETTLDRDEDGYYMAGHGEYLRDAVETPAGWVCSKRCRSQAMFAAASPFEREALLKVHDACRALAEYGKDAMRVMDAGMDEAPVWLTDEAAALLEAVGDDGNNMPEWCNHA